jgi:cytidine deaminase
MRLPPIVKPEDRGIGDVIARMAQTTGITPCGGCRERQRRLNDLMPFRRS